MGKSNRIRTKKASEAVSFGIKPKKKKGMPNWAVNLITATIAIVIVAGVALSVMSANGTFSRWQTAAKSDNFRVNGNMMKYYFQSTYSDFMETNGSYLSYMGFDSKLPLKSQPLDPNDPTQGTWFDYMTTMTKSEVTRMLVYCEEAEARGIELNDEDKDAIKEQLEMYKTYAELYQYPSANSYLASVYGEGVKMRDIRKAMELSLLASKCASEISNEVKAGVTDEMINAEYDGNKLDYDIADYMTYTFKVTYNDAVEAVCGKDATDEVKTEKAAEIRAKYLELIEAERTKAAALAALNNAADFKDAVLKEIAPDVYDASYDAADNESDIATEKVPTEDNLNKIKNDMCAHAITLVKEGKAYEKLAVVNGDKYTIFGVEVTKEFAEFVDGTDEVTGLGAAFVSDLQYNIDLYVKEDEGYAEDDDILKWIFGEGRKAGDVNTVEAGDNADKAALAENNADLSKFEISVYLLTEAQHRDATKTKNIGILAFSTEDEAKAALAQLKTGMSLAEFEALAGENGTFTNFEDYAKGDSGVSMFDDWAFSDSIKVGDVTAEIIVLAQGTYGLALYHGEGHEKWYVTVRDSIFSEKVENIGEEITNKYTVTYNDKAIAKIDA